jgi:hypothetical protein
MRPGAASSSAVVRAALEDRDTGLRLLLEVLGRLEELNLRDATAQQSVWRARDAVVRARASSSQVPSATDLARAQALLGHVEDMLLSLAGKQEELAADPRSAASRSSSLKEFQKVREAYLDVLPALLESRAVELLARAERSAERLPRALLEVELLRLASRPAGHALLEPSRRDIVEWVDWLRRKLDALELAAQQLGEARRGGGADVARREGALQTLAESIQLSVEALGYWEQALEAYASLAKGGNLLPQAYASAGRIVARCREMKAAATAEKVDGLRGLVRQHREDPNVALFLRGLPLVVTGSRLLESLCITLVASVITAGVGGLVSGALGAARVGAGLSFAGSVAVESLTFTTVSRGAQALLPGDASPEPLWADLAWNLGLFSVLRGVSASVRALVQHRGLPSLAEASLEKAGSFGVLQAYGGLHQRVSSGHWPTEDEWRTMTAHNLILMMGLAVGLRAVQEVLPRLGTNSALVRFSRDYGRRFQALADVRAKVEGSYRDARARGRLSPQEVESLRSRARVLEGEFRKLLAEVEKDSRINVQGLREEWASVAGLAEEASAELLARLLELSNAQDGLRLLGGERQYSYAWGRTNNLETRFRSLGAQVRKTVDSRTRLRSMTVRFGEDSPLTLVERSSPYPAQREVNVDPQAPEVLKLFAEFGITEPKLQRYVLRDISTEMAKDPKAGLSGPLRVVRRGLKNRAALGPVQQQLRMERHTGRLSSQAEPRLVQLVNRLDTMKILSSEEWMDCRDDAEFRGAVGEWLARSEALPLVASDSALLVRIHFWGQLFEDSAMRHPYKSKTDGSIDVAPELDMLYVTKVGEHYQYARIANIKVTEPKSAKDFRAHASSQNQMASEALQAHFEGRAAQVVTNSGKVLYGQISEIVGYDALSGSEVDLTGRLVPYPGGVVMETVLPRGSIHPEGADLPFTYKDISTVTHLLRERQLSRSTGY